MPRTAFAFAPTTGAYIGEVRAQESPKEPGSYLRPLNALFKSVPAFGKREIPMFEPDFAPEATVTRNDLVTNDSDWIVRPDWRDVALYRKADGLPFVIELPGVTPGDDVTEKPRPSLLHVWKDDDWTVNAALLTASLKADRDALLATAQLRVAPLADAVELASATTQEIAALALWKQYRIELSRLEQQPGFPFNVAWPVAPDAQSSL